MLFVCLLSVKRREMISVKVFGALLHSLQSVANLLHGRQSVVPCVNTFAVMLVKV